MVNQKAAVKVFLVEMGLEGAKTASMCSSSAYSSRHTAELVRQAYLYDNPQDWAEVIELDAITLGGDRVSTSGMNLEELGHYNDAILVDECDTLRRIREGAAVYTFYGDGHGALREHIAGAKLYGDEPKGYCHAQKLGTGEWLVIVEACDIDSARAIASETIEDRAA